MIMWGDLDGMFVGCPLNKESVWRKQRGSWASYSLCVLESLRPASCESMTIWNAIFVRTFDLFVSLAGSSGLWAPLEPAPGCPFGIYCCHGQTGEVIDSLSFMDLWGLPCSLVFCGTNSTKRLLLFESKFRNIHLKYFEYWKINLFKFRAGRFVEVDYTPATRLFLE